MRPILAFRWSRWPWCSSHADAVDAAQRRMLGKMFRSYDEALSEEQNRAFMKNQTAMLAEEVGVWSLRWADSLVSWSDHCRRGNGAAAVHRKLLNHFNHDDLVATRAEAATPFGESRLNKRLPIGKVATRFQEGVLKAQNLPRQRRNKFRSASFSRSVQSLR